MTNIKGGWSGQLILCKKPQPFAQNCPTLTWGVLAAKHVFAALAYVGDIIMLPAGTVPLAKALKGWDDPQTGIS